MSLSQLILIYMGQVPENGNEAAAAVATADLGAQDAYAILAIIESLDPQVSKTWGVHVDLLQHARNASRYWLVRTSQQDLKALAKSHP